MSDYLGDNLKLLCSHYRSIAEVCRKLAINRAQFNRYLAGQTLHVAGRPGDAQAQQQGEPAQQQQEEQEQP